jgi:hypothetical protein
MMMDVVVRPNIGRAAGKSKERELFAFRRSLSYHSLLRMPPMLSPHPIPEIRP